MSSIVQKTAVVAEKSIKPSGPKSKFKRGTQDSSSTKSEAQTVTKTEPLSDHEFCEQLLADGFVQSYVDFYHLTHRADPNDPNSVKVNISVEDMQYIRNCLTEAESARRVGNTANVYSSYTKLADYYCGLLDWRTSLFFHQKCLDVAQLTSDLRAEMAGNHALGLVNQKMGDFEKARLFHERHEMISVSVDAEEELAKSNSELYKVYLGIADKFEQEGSLEEAMSMHQKCLGAAKKCWNKAAEAEANGKIGNVLLRLDQPSESVSYLQKFSEISAELGDANARCRACSSLALAYDSLGMADKALTELNLVQTISEQAGDLLLQANACKAMGTLYSKVGNLSEAVNALQRHFDLLKILDARSSSEGNRSVWLKELDLARVYVGISKGNAQLGKYVIAIKFDFSALLDWKLTRSDKLKSIKLQRNDNPPVIEAETITSFEEEGKEIIADVSLAE